MHPLITLNLVKLVRTFFKVVLLEWRYDTKVSDKAALLTQHALPYFRIRSNHR